MNGSNGRHANRAIFVVAFPHFSRRDLVSPPNRLRTVRGASQPLHECPECWESAHVSRLFFRFWTNLNSLRVYSVWQWHDKALWCLRLTDTQTVAGCLRRRRRRRSCFFSFGFFHFFFFIWFAWSAERFHSRFWSRATSRAHTHRIHSANPFLLTDFIWQYEYTE